MHMPLLSRYEGAVIGLNSIEHIIFMNQKPSTSMAMGLLENSICIFIFPWG